MRLLYLPIVSVTRYFFAGKPISSYPSKANSTALSKPSWVMPAILEPVRCFLRSIQNIGGAAGFSFAVFVRLKCGLFVPEESDRRRFSRPLSLAACRRRTISSFSGWFTRSTLAPSVLFSSSFTMAETIPASNAMPYYPFPKVHSSVSFLPTTQKFFAKTLPLRRSTSATDAGLSDPHS